MVLNHSRESDGQTGQLNKVDLQSSQPVENGFHTDPGSSNKERAVKQLDAQLMLFSVNAINTPVESILSSLANDAGLQLHLTGQLSANVTLTVENLALNTLLDSLARQAGFAWNIENLKLTIWSGVAYGFSYPVNYLNIRRSTRSLVGLATQVGTINAADDAIGSVANSSQTQVENASEHHFWQSLEADISGMLDSESRSASTDKTAGPARYSINKEAGLLTVFAQPGVHQTVKRYLALLQRSSQRQVLIEATVVEVALSNSFEAGVDWQVLAKGINGISAAQVLAGAPLVNAQTVGRLTAPTGLISLVQQGGQQEIQATLSLLEQFGDVRILSRPRIIALNNQSSVLKVVDNRVYFTVNVQRRQNENDSEIETETEIHTVPVGLVMNVTPQISDDGLVMLNVRPTLSRILGFVNDPNPALAQANVRNGVPEIQVREMETMLQVQSGQVAVIGGLMQETQSDNDARLPGLARLAGIGRLFRNKSRKHKQTELMVVIRPTVISSDVHGVDP
jgi:general secretion pathway protein D